MTGARPPGARRMWWILLALAIQPGTGKAQPPLPEIEISRSGPSAAAPTGVEILEPWTPDPASPPFHPEALARDGLGRLFALDRGRGQIVRIDVEGQAQPFGAGEQGGARFAQLTALFAAQGPDLFALDASQSVLFQFDLEGRLRTQIRYAATADRLGLVDAVDFALDKSGELLVLDRSGGRLLRFDRFGRFLVDLAAGTTGDARLVSPTRVDLSGSGEIFVFDPAGASVRCFSRQGDALPAWRYDRSLPAGAAPGGQMAVAPWNHVVVVARDASWIRVFTADGSLLRHETLEESTSIRVTDLIAGPDSILHLARPRAGQIERLRLRYAEPASSPRP